MGRTFCTYGFQSNAKTGSYGKESFLRITPIGTCIEEVITIVRNNERWRNVSISRESGFPHPRGIVLGWPLSELRAVSIVGSKSIRTRVEVNAPWILRLWLLSERNLHIYWGFDEDGKLIEVYVSSTYSW